MNWKVGDVLVSLSSKKLAEITDIIDIIKSKEAAGPMVQVKYNARKGNSSVLMGFIFENAMNTYYRKATNREAFLYYIGVNDLNEDT